MRLSAITPGRVVFAIYLATLHLLVLFLLAGQFGVSFIWLQDEFEHGEVRDPTPPRAAPVPPEVPKVLSDRSMPVNGDLPEIIIPVKGVSAEDLYDSFNEPRSVDRGHNAIDIPAPEGTPVLAATDGRIARFFDSVPGGITIYQTSMDGKFVFYYAHLQRRADGLEVGNTVVKGQEIGYVGDTGNASPGNFHLHFSVAAITDPARIWEGDYLNPFELLKKSDRKYGTVR